MKFKLLRNGMLAALLFVFDSAQVESVDIRVVDVGAACAASL